MVDILDKRCWGWRWGRRKRGCSEGGHAEGELCQTFECCCTSVFIVVLLVRETSSYVVQGTLVIGAWLGGDLGRAWFAFALSSIGGAHTFGIARVKSKILIKIKIWLLVQLKCVYRKENMINISVFGVFTQYYSLKNLNIGNICYFKWTTFTVLRLWNLASCVTQF